MSRPSAVSAQHFPDPVALVVSVRVFGAGAARPRTLTVHSAGHPAQTVTVRTALSVAIAIRTPVQNGGTYAAIWITLDAIDSPCALGLSPDDRHLGVQITELARLPALLDWPLDLTAPDQPLGILGHGWAAHSPGQGVWSIAQEAHLVVPGYLRRENAHALAIEADVLERSADMPPLEVEAICNRQTAARWQIPAGPVAALHCPLPGWYDNTDYPVILLFYNLRTPADLGINSDTRPLGLYIRQIGLVPAQNDSQTPVDQGRPTLS